MNSQTSTSKVKAVFQLFKRLFANIGATIVLFIGIAIMAAGIGGALWMMPTAFLPTIISSMGGFIGAFIIAGVLHRFAISPNNDNGKLEEALAETKEVQQKNLELSKSLEKAEESLKKERDALKKVQAENAKLLHRLDTFVNITKIQPVMKLVTGELTFDITDFYEKRLDDNEPYKHLTSRKMHENPEYYRGVYKYSGRLNMAVDLAKIKMVETADSIIICGPFEYEPLLNLDYETKWLMHGRREQEFRHGQSEKDMETYEIKVNKTRDPDLEEEQVNLVQKNLKNLKIVDSMRTFTDKIVVEFIKLMLAPTGKKIAYSPTGNGAFSTKPLSELVTNYNNKITMLSQPDYSLDS